MLKRCFAFLLATVLLSLPLAAWADVLIEPNSDFYTRHRDECAYMNRDFYANGQDGFVSVKKEPGSQDEVTTVVNGETLFIMFTYNLGGEVWGVADFNAPAVSYNQRLSGWVPMDQLVLVYDYLSFDEEHQAEFYPYTGGYEALYEGGEIVFWTWPGSGEAAWTFKPDNIENNQNFLTADHAYKDSDGREWGFFPYVYGHRNSWVCLSDPFNSSLPASDPAPRPELRPPKEPDAVNTSTDAPVTRPADGENPETSDAGGPPTLLIVILVSALVVGTALLILALWNPKKRGS